MTCSLIKRTLCRRLLVTIISIHIMILVWRVVTIMEEKDYDEIAVGLLQNLTNDLNDVQFNYVSTLSILTLLLEKGIFTEEEYKEKSELYKGMLVDIK